MGVIFCMIVGLLFSFEPITDNDWFWHYVVGNYISKEKTIPTHDLFSWASGKDWIAHEWLNELIMYKLGPIGCIAIMLLIFIGLYYIMAKCLRLKINKIFDFKLLYFLIMCIFFKVTGPRPYIISLITLAYLIYVLFSYLDDEKWAKKMVWTLPILQIIWVNFHGGSSSMIYIFIIGVLMCHYFLKLLPFNNERWTKFTLKKEQVKTLIILLILTIITTGFNPFVYKMLLYPFTNMLDDSMLSIILEWHSPNFHGFLGMYIFIMIALPLFNLILNKKNMKLHEIGFQLLFFFMCLKSQRFIGMYGIYSTWTMGKYFFVEDEFYEKIKKPFKRFEKIIYCGFIFCLVIFTIGVGYTQIKNFKAVGPIDNDGYYSDEVVLKLIELQPQRLYNDFGQGGYLIYKLNELGANNIKIFSYGLGDVFSQDILPDASVFQDIEADPNTLLEKYNFDYLLVKSDYPTRYYFEIRPDYELVYQDETATIFKKINDL